VLKIGIDIADVLDKAHRAGITHRDVKPANIFLVRRGGASASAKATADRRSVTREGWSVPPEAKVLYFGLAKSSAPTVVGHGFSRAGTAEAVPYAAGITAQGTILGTFQYMAPEQVEGRDVDERSDIWALGAVLYEMTTGRRPFDGASAASVIGAILRDTPPAVSTRQPLAPSALDHLVERCLKKDADDRWQDAGDVKGELAWIAEGGTAVAVAGARTRNPWPERVAWITAAAGVLIALLFVLRPASAPTMGDVVRLSILPPDKILFTGQSTATAGVPQLAVSPDGRAIVFAAAAPGARPTLWLRSLDTVTAHSILFSRGITGILRVSSSGGMVTPVTQLDASRQERSHRFPQFLPDGRHFLFTVRTSLADQMEIVV
jgi:hypothetical protein